MALTRPVSLLKGLKNMHFPNPENILVNAY